MDNLSSKDWKERKNFYSSINWSSIPSQTIAHTQLTISSEQTVPALESAIQALISCPHLTYKDSKKILNNISNIKLKGLLILYVEEIIKKDKTCVNVMVDDVVGSIKSVKLGKVVQIYCEILGIIIDKMREIMFDLALLECVLNNADPNVRREGVNLCVMVYKHKGEALYEAIGKVKDILVKEIKDAVSKVEKEIQYEEKKNDLPIDIQDKNNFIVSETQTIVRNISPSNSLLNNLKSSDYKERLQALNNVKNEGVVLTIELQNIIVSKIDDVNLQVSLFAIECCRLFNINKEVIKLLIDKMKDRKTKNQVLAVLQEKAISSDEIIDSLDLSNFKNPVMKCGILEYLCSNQITVKAIEMVIILVDDSNKEVRALAMKYCQNVHYSKYSNLLPNKILQKLEKNSCNTSMILEEKTIKTDFQSHVKSVKDIKKHENISASGSEDHQKIIEYFLAKYPFLTEETPTNRYTELQKSGIFNEVNFIIFACTYKDTFFKTNILYIDKILQIDIPNNLIELVFTFWIKKIGEDKLKCKIVDLMLHLWRINNSIIVDKLHKFIKEKKTGKLFCEGIMLLGLVGDETSIKFIESIDKRTKIEKDAAITAIDSIRKGEGKKYTSEHEYKPKLNLVNKEASFDKKIDKAEIKPSIENESAKRKHSQSATNIIKQKIKTRIKDCKNKEIIFEKFFIDLLDNSKEYNKVLNLFDGEDKIYLSDFIIEYIYKQELVRLDQYTVFEFVDRLINHFIEREYMLKEIECIMLYEIVHTRKELVKKLEFVYPKSKLKRIVIDRSEIADVNASFHSLNINTSNIASPSSKMRKMRTSINIEKSIFTHTKIEEKSIVRNETCFNEEKAYFQRDNKTFKEVLNVPISASVDASKKPVQVTEQYSNNSFNTSSNVSSLVDSSKIDKYRMEFFKKNNEGLHFDRIRLERIFLNLIHYDPDICESAFMDLRNVISISVDSIMFSSNSIISSILIQLNDSIVTNNQLAIIIIGTLLQLCSYPTFVNELSFSSLRAINIEMMNNLRLTNELDLPESVKTCMIRSSADILTKICQYSNQPLILKVYLSLIELIKEEHKQILYNLVWNHSKSMVKTFEIDDRAKIQEIIDTLSEFLENNCLRVIKNNVPVTKVIQFHLNEICDFYRNRVYEFKINGLVKKIVDKILSKVDVSIGHIKDEIENIKKDFYSK